MTKLLFRNMDGGNCLVCGDSLPCVSASITTTPCWAKKTAVPGVFLACLPCVKEGINVTGTFYEVFNAHQEQVSYAFTKLRN